MASASDWDYMQKEIAKRSLKYSDLPNTNPCDTGWPSPNWHKSGPLILNNDVMRLNALLEKPATQRCSYCNVKPLPNDRFCEGCGALV